MLQLTFHGLDRSDAVASAVEARAAHLTQLCPKLTSIRVVIERPHGRHRHGNHYRVLLEVSAPTGDVIVGRDPAARVDDEDVYVAVKRAFDTAARLLADARRARRARRARAVARGERTLTPS